MPLYDYQCEKCGHMFEVMQSFSDAPISQCPECKAKKVQRLISRPALHFKGGGFYITDSKGGGKSAAVPSTATSDSSSGKEAAAAATTTPSAPAAPKSGGCAHGGACSH